MKEISEYYDAESLRFSESEEERDAFLIVVTLTATRINTILSGTLDKREFFRVASKGNIGDYEYNFKYSYETLATFAIDVAKQYGIKMSREEAIAFSSYLLGMSLAEASEYA